MNVAIDAVIWAYKYKNPWGVYYIRLYNTTRVYKCTPQHTGLYYSMLSMVMIMSDQPTIEIRNKLDAHLQESQIVSAVMINNSRPTSRTSDYCSLSVPVEHEDFIVGTIDNHDGGTQTKINILVKVHGYKSFKYMAVEGFYIVTRSKICDENDSRGKLNASHIAIICIICT